MFEALGIGAGILGSIGSLFSRNNANEELDKINAKNQKLAAERLGLAKTLFNARMPGAAKVESNILGNQANTISTIQKNATDAGQVLGAAAQVQGQTNNAFNKLGLAEGDDFQRRYSNLNSGYDDYKKALDDEAQIKGAQQQNNGQSWHEISNLGFGLADLSVNGAFDNMFKNKNPGGYNNIGRMDLGMIPINATGR